jgi:hypothetical protein
VENGGGSFTVDWVLVQPAVSQFTRICTYDRAGYAWSDPGPLRDLPEQIMADLELLLRLGDVKPPYVLVGQSTRRTKTTTHISSTESRNRSLLSRAKNCSSSSEIVWHILLQSQFRVALGHHTIACLLR